MLARFHRRVHRPYPLTIKEPSSAEVSPTQDVRCTCQAALDQVRRTDLPAVTHFRLHNLPDKLPAGEDVQRTTGLPPHPRHQHRCARAVGGVFLAKRGQQLAFFKLDAHQDIAGQPDGGGQ
jgi:hypothetical protein